MLTRTTVLFILLVSTAFGQDSPSPFQSPDRTPPVAAQPPPASTTLDGFEFNGVMEIDGELRISLFDTKVSRNIWVRDGEVGEFGVTFRGYDKRNETVVIVQGGVSKKLALNKVKIETLRIPSQRNLSVDAATATANATVNESQNRGQIESEEESRARIQRVAEEIRRRRAERRQKLEERSRNITNE